MDTGFESISAGKEATPFLQFEQLLSAVILPTPSEFELAQRFRCSPDPAGLPEGVSLWDSADDDGRSEHVHFLVDERCVAAYRITDYWEHSQTPSIIGAWTRWHRDVPVGPGVLELTRCVIDCQWTDRGIYELTAIDAVARARALPGAELALMVVDKQHAHLARVMRRLGGYIIQPRQPVISYSFAGQPFEVLPIIFDLGSAALTYALQIRQAAVAAKLSAAGVLIGSSVGAHCEEAPAAAVSSW